MNRAFYNPAGRGTPRNWYHVAAKADSDVAELQILEAIGRAYAHDGEECVAAATIVKQLSQLPKAVRTIRVFVSSPGGDVFEALTIANALRWHERKQSRTTEAIVIGVAASAATIITSACSRIQIADSALMMVHEPIAYVEGQAPDFRKVADDLEKFRESIVDAYQWCSHLSRSRLLEMIAATTWMSSSEAVACGFAHEVIADDKAAAPAAVASNRFQPAARALLGTVPDGYRARIDRLIGSVAAGPSAPAPAPAPTSRRSSAPPSSTAASAADVLRIVSAHGVLAHATNGLSIAEDLINQGATIEEVNNRVMREKTARDAAAARARDISALCRHAFQGSKRGPTDPSVSAFTETFVKSQLPIESVKAYVQNLLAWRADAVEIDSSFFIDGDVEGGGVRAADRINLADIYRRRNSEEK